MNAQRRKEIEKVLKVLEGAHMDIEAIKEDETDAFYAIPDTLHGTENHDNAERSASNLEEAETYLMECIEQLHSSIE